MPTAPPSSREVSLGSRRDALLLGGERLGDRLSGGGHGQAHPEADEDEAGEHRQVAALHRCPQRHRGQAAGEDGRHPVAIVLRRPIRLAIRGAIVDIGIIIAVIGSRAAAESSTDQPSTAWK